MAFHARRRATMSVGQMRRWHVTPDIIRPCVLPKGRVGIPRFISSNSMSSPRAIMTCHARRRSSVCVVQRDPDIPPPTSYSRLGCPRAMQHVTPNIIRLRVLHKGYDGMPHPTLCDHVSCPRAMMACHALHSLIVCVVQG